MEFAMLSYPYGVNHHVLGVRTMSSKLEELFNLTEIGKSAIYVFGLVAAGAIFYSKTTDHFDRIDQQVLEIKAKQEAAQTQLSTNIEDIKSKQQAQLITLTQIQTTLNNQADSQARKESYRGMMYHKPLSASNSGTGSDKSRPDKEPSGGNKSQTDSTFAYENYTQASPYSHR